MEEWLYLDRFGRGMSPFALYEQILRPMGYLQTYFPFLLTPGSFVGQNLLHLVYMWGKGMALFLVLRELRAKPAFALAAALLFVLHPADTGQMTLRTTVIHGHLMYLMVAIWWLLQLARRFRLGLALATLALLAFTLLVYEAGYPLAWAAPLLLLALGKNHAADGLKASLLWYGTLLLLVGRYVLVFASGVETYNAEILAFEQGGERLANMFAALGGAYARVLWVGWVEAFESLKAAGWGDLAIGLLSAALAGFAVAALGPCKDAKTKGGARFSMLVAVAASAIVALGFLMYLPTQVRASTWRTLFLPSVGGGLMAAAILWWVCSRRLPGGRLFFAVASGLGVLLGTVHLTAQHRAFAEVSWNQQRVLAGILRAAPRIEPEVELLLLIDQGDPAAISPQSFPYSRYFRAALTYLYGLEGLNAQVCYPFFPRRGERCEFGRESALVDHIEPDWLHPELAWDVDYERLLVFERDRDGRISLLETLPRWYSLQPGDLSYHPGPLLEEGGARHPRFLKVPPVVASGRTAGESLEHLAYEFDEDRLVGAGWGGLRKNDSGITYRFMLHERAALHLPLQPRSYRLELRIANGLSDKLLNSLRLQASAQPIPLRRTGPGTYQGQLFREQVEPGSDTTLLFEVDAAELHRLQAERGPRVGLGVDWLRIEPERAERPSP